MKTSLLALALIASALVHRGVADSGNRHFMYKATALFPVQIEKPDPKNPGGTILTKVTLGTKEIVNLALARPFDTPLNPKTEQLAVDINDVNHNQTTLVVYRPDSGLIFPVCELTTGGTPVTRVTNPDPTPTSHKGKGTGLAPGTIFATDPSFGAPAIAQNSLQSTDLCASTSASFGPGAHNPIFTASATGIIGDIKGKMTSKKPGSITADLDGLIVKGSFTSGGFIKLYFE